MPYTLKYLRIVALEEKLMAAIWAIEILHRMLNRLGDLAEEKERILSSLASRLKDFDAETLKYSLAKYGTYSTHRL